MNKKESDSIHSAGEWKMIGVRLPQELIKATKQYALDHDMSMQNVVVEALQIFLKKNAGKEHK